MSQSVPQICQLNHAGFRMLGEPVFRLSEGTRVASMVVQVDKHDVVLPLRSVAREFNIEPETPDGKMLELVEQALGFVVAIRLGEKLPSELNGGEASWEPSEQDSRVALSRVRHSLVRGVFARMGQTFTIEGGAVPGWEESSKNLALLRQAITGAAASIEGSNEADVIARIATISGELAYVECLRRTLTRGMSGLKEKLLRIPIGQAPVSRQETVKQVQALARRGLAEITRRFDEVDGRFDDVSGVLRDMPTAIAWVRRQRDWLFRTRLAWEAVFADWAGAPNHYDDFLWKILERTYLFLAPRFMSFQDWAVKDARLPKQQDVQSKVW